MLKTFGIILGTFFTVSLGWAALFYQAEDPVILSTFDVFTTLVTFVSLAMNVIQWRESRAMLLPIRNPLIALFNELKTRQQRVWSKQRRINEQTTPIEFYDFAEEVIQGFEQLREHVISLIETVSPEMRDEDFFRASTRGLTTDEKESRQDWIQRRRREENRQAAVIGEPARTLFRKYEGDLEAIILRSFTSGFEWTLEDKTNKVVIDDGATDSVEVAKAQADVAAKAKPATEWKSRP